MYSFIPQIMLALWDSQLVLRGSGAAIADSGSGWEHSWDPSRDPSAETLKNKWKTLVLAQEAKQKLAKPSENGKRMLVLRKLAKP